MRLEVLEVFDVRNHTHRRLELAGGLNLIGGPNGSGKSTLLEAAHLLCLGRSPFSTNDSQLIRFDQPGLKITGQVAHESAIDRLELRLFPPKRKQLARNSSPYERLSDHVGRYPVVMIAPQDVELIEGPRDGRHRFLDRLLGQLEPGYVDRLIAYQKTLQQRNAMLRRREEEGPIDLDLLDTYDQQLVRHGGPLVETRQKWCTQMQSLVQAAYATLAGDEEPVDFQYVSQALDVPLGEGLAQARSRDLRASRSTFGPHRDELEMTLRGQPIRTYGSQGQRKSYLIALKLLSYRLLREACGTAPLLLFDDYAERLDAGRIGRFFELITEEGVEQVILTNASLSDEVRLAFPNQGIRNFTLPSDQVELPYHDELRP